MSNAQGVPSFVAGGNIAPCRFLVLSNDFTVIQSNATPGEPPIGVSSEATMFPPNTPFDNGFAATTGYTNFRVYQEDDVCFVETGVANVGGGDYLRPDANGRAQPATTGTYYGAISLEGATASGTRIRCKVMGGYFA